MPNAPKTPNHTVRIPDERWAAVDEVAKATGTDRPTAINALLAWYTRERGARLPKRADMPAGDSE